jgi:hypothetical protein
MTTFVELLNALRDIRDSMYKDIIDGGEQALFNAVIDLYNYMYDMTSFDREVFREKYIVFYSLWNEMNGGIFVNEPELLNEKVEEYVKAISTANRL